MTQEVKSFGEIATSLARNPLSIIALFIVFIYALAALVTATSTSLSGNERLPLIYFMVLFPVLVLGVFAWLVGGYSDNLFGPTDFKDERNYVEIRATVAASLAAATGRTAQEPPQVSEIVNAVTRSIPTNINTTLKGAKILWVDDHPENNAFVKQAFEAVGIDVSLALSTTEAISFLNRTPVSAIISDMGRSEGPQEGYALLEKLRKSGNSTPFFIFAGSNKPEHKRETIDRGGQASTNNAQELFQAVLATILAKARH